MKTGAEGFEYSSGFLCVIVDDATFPARRIFKKCRNFPPYFFFLYLGWAVKVTLIEKTTDRVQQGDDRVVLLIPVISPLNVVPSKSSHLDD